MFTQMAIKATPVGRSSCFVLETEWMHGDANGYTKEESVIDEKNLFEVAAFYEACRAVESEGEGGPGYSKVPGYDRWGNTPSDITCEDCEAALESWAIFYYSEHGAKFAVEFT